MPIIQETVALDRQKNRTAYTFVYLAIFSLYYATVRLGTAVTSIPIAFTIVLPGNQQIRMS